MVTTMYKLTEILYRISQNGEIIRRDSVTLGYMIPDPEGGISIKRQSMERK